ncbi:uncharacterized protein BXZ73DRAFT_102863 [Epithele typhae]|uniref:uncharacterized protein n=1 Tax=Epithele typhae TaxID=378194 RepID=UPI002008B9F5|nr:uncharacterized protein BXZ73DRAFT_102863 [Epithele typhae]KAH9926604.1 hypothetical protein BXZ73DRAFT_102863 [Epithele typhae]
MHTLAGLHEYLKSYVAPSVLHGIGGATRIRIKDRQNSARAAWKQERVTGMFASVQGTHLHQVFRGDVSVLIPKLHTPVTRTTHGMLYPRGHSPQITHLHLNFLIGPKTVETLGTLIHLLLCSPAFQLLFVQHCRNMEIDEDEYCQSTDSALVPLDSPHVITFLECDWIFSTHVIACLALPLDVHINIFDVSDPFDDDDVAIPQLPLFDSPLRMSLFLSCTFAVVKFDGPPNPARANHPIGRFHNAQEGYDDYWIQIGFPGMPPPSAHKLRTLVLNLNRPSPFRDTPNKLEFVGALLGEVLRPLPWCAETPRPSLRTLGVQLAQGPDDTI